MLLADRTETPTTRTRAHDRFVYTEACFVQSRSRSFNGRARNISPGGISLTLHGLGALQCGDSITLYLQDFPPIEGIVRWTKARTIGVQFIEDVADHPSIQNMIERVSIGESPRVSGPRKPAESTDDPIADIVAWIKGMDSTEIE